MLVSPIRWILSSHLTTMGDRTMRLAYNHRLLSNLNWFRVSLIRHLARYGIPQDPSRIHGCVRKGLAGLWLKLSMTVMWLW